MANPTVAVLEYHVAVYRRSWRETVFSSFATPVLLFVGIGIALGGYVDGGGNGPLGLSYVDYVAPGMLAFTGVQVAITESGYQVQSYMKWDRIYHGMAAAPPGVWAILVGQLLYLGLRVALSAIAFLLVMLVLGATDVPTAALAPVVAVLGGIAVATPMMAYSATVDGPYLMAVIRFCTLPMVFFSGVFFPLDQLPELLRPVAFPLPMWHAAELCRAATAGVPTAWPVAAHLAVLGVWAGCGLWFAHRQFVLGLAD